MFLGKRIPVTMWLFKAMNDLQPSADSKQQRDLNIILNYFGTTTSTFVKEIR